MKRTSLHHQWAFRSVADLVQVASGADYVAGMNSNTAQARTHGKSPCDWNYDVTCLPHCFL